MNNRHSAIREPALWPVTLATVALLSACATPPATDTASPTAMPLRVTYSTNLGDGQWLKDKPEEVSIVTRATTGKAVAAQVFMNVAMIALVGGVGVRTFSKDQLQGERIDDVTHRDHLRNPVPDAFVSRLQQKIDAAVAADPALSDKLYEHPLVVGGGSAALVYHTLAGTDEESYQLRTELKVYKRREKAGLFTMRPHVAVDCNDTSAEPLPRARWAQRDYLLVRETLDAALAACETRVIAQLPQLLIQE